MLRGGKYRESVRVRNEGADLIDFRSSLSYLQHVSLLCGWVNIDGGGSPRHQRGGAPFFDVLP